MKRSIVHCYLIELEFVKDARKSLLEEYSMSAWRLVIPNIRTGYFSWRNYIQLFVRARAGPKQFGALGSNL